MIAAFLLWIASPALASHVNVTFCADYRVSYQDDGSIGDDFFSDHGAAWYSKARGARIKVFEESTGDLTCEGYANDTAPDMGCITCDGPAALETAETYTVRIMSKAQVNGHTFKVVNASGTLFHSDALSGWTPAAGTMDIATTTVHDAWRISAVAGWAFHRADGGGTPPSDAWVFWNADICPDGQNPAGFPPGQACSMVNQTIGLSPAYQADIDGDGILDDVPSRATHKYSIAHEIGHALVTERDEDGLPGSGASQNEYQLAPGVCFTNQSSGAAWEQNSKEFQSTAAVEGFADFYAAMIFNQNQPDDDCFYNTRATADWNLDGSTGDNTIVPSCDLGPYADGFPQAPEGWLPVDWFDYLGDHCLTGAGVNRATVYDYTRFLWDLNTGSQGCSGAVSFDDLLTVWDLANPKNWNPDDIGSAADFPAARLRAAATSALVLTEWDSCDDLHGVHR